MINQAIQGFFSPLRGFKIILSSGKNIGFALIPFVIGAVVISLGFFGASELLNPWVESLTQDSQFFKDWSWLKPIVDIFLMVFSWVLVALLNFLLGYLCIIILAGPFYALMVENIFKLELPDKEPRTNVKLMFQMFGAGIMKALLFLVIGILCFFLAFIPGINFLAPLIMILTVAFDCMDYAFEVDFLKLKERVAFFKAHMAFFLGLAGAIFLTNLIPGLFFIILPAFICGATDSYIRLNGQAV